MRYIYSIVFILLTTNSIFSQKSEKLFHFGASISPKISIQKLDDKDLGTTEKELSLALSGDIYYDINEFIQLKSGVNINIIKTSQLDYSPRFSCDHNGQGGVNIYNSYYKTNIKAFYIGIPLDAKIKIVGNENHLFLLLGIQNLIKVSTSENVELIECMNRTLDVEDNFLFTPKKYLAILNSGIGIEFKVFKNKKMILQPLLELSLSDTYEKVGIVSSVINNSRLLNYGISVGIKL